MSFRLPTLCFFIFIQFGIFAQEFQWNANLNYFFDNNEFAKSTITKDQTMNGVRFSPEFGLSWDTSHSFYAGADLLKISGSQKTIDKVDLIAYYQYHTNKSYFQAGAFPRNKLLSNYSDLFFQDSIQYFHPVMEGLFWQLNSKNAFFNIWLDWNGHQTALNRETFYIGSSAHKSLGNLFIDFQSYMYHFANARPQKNPTNRERTAGPGDSGPNLWPSRPATTAPAPQHRRGAPQSDRPSTRKPKIRRRMHSQKPPRPDHTGSWSWRTPQ